MKNHESFQIETTPATWVEIFDKLRKLGFVFGRKRVRTIEELDRTYKRSKYLFIGENQVCKMTIHGSRFPAPAYVHITVTTVDEFAANHFSAYDAA